MQFCMAFAAKGNKLEQEFIAEMSVGKMMNLSRLRLTAALAKIIRALEYFPALLAPGIRHAVALIPGPHAATAVPRRRTGMFGHALNVKGQHRPSTSNGGNTTCSANRPG